MTRSLLRSFGLALVGLLTLAGPVLAGGWAVTTIDALPEGGFRAGETYRIGYMIRQHGQMPFAGAQTEIIIQSSDGQVSRFPGVADGPVGHYAAEVTFPAAGDWTWEVNQGPFAPQKLGRLQVAPGAATTSASDSAQPDLAPLGGVDEGAVGHYVAEVTFLPAASSSANEGTQPDLAPVRLVLPLAALLALALFGWRLARFGHQARPRQDLTPASAVRPAR